MTTNTIKQFIESHRADDIVYALTHHEYFGLSDAERTALHAWVFQAIDKARTDN